ncbi:hypothetical protein EV182_003466 [Spiromyces aspiralis]|uniref:Uncharacterized protein n=1 Tax=Spiromyces aspiralis TaxID=68401 RepID=A0ACC1HXW6_9FUNG|nr:hypothetical protein EV182_003466 [Spiromyces aspiralis]
MRGPAARTAEARYKKRPPSLRHVAPNRRSISDPSHITFDFKSPYEPSVIPTVTFAIQRVNYQQQRQQRSPTSPTQRRQRVLNKRSRSEVNLLSRFISESTAPAQAGPRATATAAAAATAVAVDQNDNGSYQHYFLRNHSTNKLIRKLWVSSPKRDKPELDADINRVPYSAFTSKFARATAANQPVTPMSARSTTTTAGALVSPASLTSPELSPHADSPVDPNLSRDIMMISPRSEFGGPGITNNSMAGRLMAPSPPARKLTHKLSRRVMAGSRSPVRAALEETK